MKVQVTLKIDPRLSKLLSNPTPYANAILKRAMGYAALWTAGVIRERAPIDSGRLRRSISYKVNSPQEAQVGTNVRYARIQEYGGTVTPKRGRFLVWADAPFRTPMSPARWAAAYQANSVHRATSVRLKAQNYFRNSIPYIQQNIYRFYIEAIDKILKGGGGLP